MSDNQEQGGSYVINEAGARVLVERTREPGDAPPETAPEAPAQETKTKPAKAGFFTPVAPADQPQTTE